MSRAVLPPVFVVGTGRCGSTLLSSMFRQHPDILSLSEVLVFATDLGGRIDALFAPGPVTAEAFWHHLAHPHPRQTTMLRHGVMMDEALYRPGPGTLFTTATGVPPLVATPLAHLTDQPEDLFEALAAWVSHLPPAPIGVQLTRLFDHLRDRDHRRLWVERSGGSLRVVEHLRRSFPDARFVHIVRDGRDAALSMSRHEGFRMALAASALTEILGVDPYEDPDRTFEADLPDEYVDLLPERFDPAAFRHLDTPPEMCGHYWSGEVVQGLAALEGLDPDHLLTVRYERLLERPAAELDRLFRFLLQEDPGDLSALAATVRSPRSRWQDLPPTRRDALQRACKPGFDALNAALGDPS